MWRAGLSRVGLARFVRPQTNVCSNAQTRGYHEERSLPPHLQRGCSPLFSQAALELHHQHHYTHCLSRLNTAIHGTIFQNMPLVRTVRQTAGHADERALIFQYANEVYNHEFFWSCIAPNGRPITAPMMQRIEQEFGSFVNFQTEFSVTAQALLGNGWVWLVEDPVSQRLRVFASTVGRNPITLGVLPLLTVDLWEHAYLLDFKYDRKAYIESFFNSVNWRMVEAHLNPPSVRDIASGRAAILGPDGIFGGVPGNEHGQRMAEYKVGDEWLELDRSVHPLDDDEFSLDTILDLSKDPPRGKKPAEHREDAAAADAKK